MQPDVVSTTLVGPTIPTTLADALRSVAGIVDRSLVLWTGASELHDEVETTSLSASDKTVVIEWPWRNDFGAGRQAALDFATKTGATWCLWLDSDEWIEPHGEDVRGAMLATDAAAMLMFDERGEYLQPRAIRLPCAARWEGRTHEAIPVTGPRFVSARFCSRPKALCDLLAKHRRDLVILLEETRKQPEDARWWYYLGDALAGLRRFLDALDAFRRCADLRGWDEQSAWACYRAANLLLFEFGQFEAAIDLCAQGMARHPGIAELPWLAGIAAQRLGRHEHAVWWAELARVHGEKAPEPVRALDRRRLFRVPKGLREGPSDIERFSFAVLGEPDATCAAITEFKRWQGQ